MGLFRRRPLALAGFLFLSASLAAFFLLGVFKLVIGGAVLLPLVGYAAYVFLSGRKYLRHRIIRLVLILVPVTLAMAVSFFCFDVRFDGTEEKYAGKPCVTEAIVTERTGGAFGVTYKLVANRINGEEVRIPMVLRTDGACSAVAGDSLTVTAEPISLREFADDRMMLCSYLSDGYRLGIEIDAEHLSEIQVTKGGTEASHRSLFTELQLFFSDLQNRLSLRLSDAIGSDAGSIASALLLGDRSHLSPNVTRDFRRVGASHLLALSGLHVALLSGMAGWVLKKFRIPPRVRVTLLGVLMLLYLALIGFPASALRAVLMLLATYLSFLFSAEHDTPTALFCACSLILLLSPESVCDLSFWMSFAATLGILTLYPIIHDLLQGEREHRSAKKPHRIRNALRKMTLRIAASLAVSICASIAISAVLWIFSDEYPLLSPLSTLLLMPAVTVILVVSVLCLLSSGIPILCAFFADMARVLGNYLLFVTEELAKIPNTTVPLTFRPIPYLLVGMAAVLIVLMIIRLRHRWTVFFAPLAAAVAIAAVVGISGYTQRNSVFLTYLQSGSNSEQLVLTGNGKAVIVDFSDGYASRFAQSAKIVGESACAEIRAVVLTHYHVTHISGVASLTGSSYVRELWLPYPKTEHDYVIMNRLVRDAEKAKVGVRLYANGEEMSWFSGLKAEISTTRIKRSASETFLFTLTGGNRSFVYLGSAIRESELYEKAKECVAESDLILFGAHGPKTGDEWFDASGAIGGGRTVLLANDRILGNVRFDLSCDGTETCEILKNVRVRQMILRSDKHQAD